MDDLLSLNDKIINNEIDIEELYNEVILKLKKDPLNAVAHLRIDRALEELKNTDFTNKPIKGIPIVIKNLGQELKGELNTSSSLLMKDYKSEHTDSIVKRLIDAGFIVIGQSNTPELGFKNITESKMYGTTLNAIDRKYHAGGSSGGAAALVKSNVIPLALASDGGGSIRIPASFNGLIGLKPSRGRIITGPYSHRGWQGASVHFPITKSIGDTILMLDLLSDYIKASPYSIPKPNNSFKELVNNLSGKKLRIAYSYDSPVGSAVDPDAIDALKDAVSKLEKLGHTLISDKPKYDGLKLIHGYYLMNAAEANSLIKRLTNKPSLDNLEALSYVLYHLGEDVRASTYTDVINYWDKVGLIMDDFFIDYDLFLTPSTNGIAPLLGSDESYINNAKRIRNVANLSYDDKFDLLKDLFEESLAKTPYSQLANLTGFPAISLPTYVNKDKMPVGVQLMAPREREGLLLYVGKALEDNQDLLI